MPKSRKSVSKTTRKKSVVRKVSPSKTVSKKSRQPSKKSVVRKVSPSKTVSKKSRQPSKKSAPTKEKAVAPKVMVKNDKWCDGLLNDDGGVLSSVKSQSERARILQDFDNGGYGEVHQNDDVVIEFSDWSDLDENNVFLPHQVVKKFFEKAKEPFSVYGTFTFSSLIYEEISAHAINFISDLCGSICAKRQSVITTEVVMTCMNILPLQLVMTHPIIPHDKFKLFFNLAANEVANDWSSDHVDDNAFHLLHNLFEHYLFKLCEYTLARSIKNNLYVQPFHVQSVMSLFNDFKPVALSSNPLSKIQKKSNFEHLINEVLKKLELPFFERGHGGAQIPSSIQFRRDALSQLNQIMNAIAKELVDISIYMMEHFSNMKNGSLAIESAVRSLLPSGDKRPYGYAPGELVKHALSEGKKALDNKGATLSNGFDEIKIDRLNGLNRESLLFFRGVIEYIIAEIVELAGRLLSDDNRSHIEPADIKNVVMDDEELSELIKKMKLYFVE